MVNTQGKLDSAKPEVKKDKRKYKRIIFNCPIELVSTKNREQIKGASYDLSDGGIRIVTNRELNDPEYLVVIGNKKIPAKLIYEEKRNSSMLNQTAYYHGLAFQKLINPEIRKYFMELAVKNGF
ncbi:MAG: PilZ domain-containing protein [Spirochaetia bacterium]|nr:PilZ domain-containing protein [Spirochaetia bacterium]